MGTSYQVFYKAFGRLEKINMQAVSKEMATKYLTLIHPHAEVVYVTNDPTPMEPEYVENLMSTNLIN